VRKRAWSHPAQVRRDLEELVGPVDQITKEEDIRLKLQPPIRAPAVRGVLPRIPRAQMDAIVTEPRIQPNGLPFFAKLRAEVDPTVLANKAGNLYLGLHLDPLHGAHWNNLTEPVSVKLDVPDGVFLDRLVLDAPKVEAASDTDPREFLLKVEAWPEEKPIRLTVIYMACVGDTSCHMVQQEYVLHRKRDKDGGRARGEGAGYWNPAQLTRQFMANDKDGDRKLNKQEVRGLVLPHFDSFDTNQDGLLEPEELKSVAHWLNYHHAPGRMRETP
jgi:hypothetical protein